MPNAQHPKPNAQHPAPVITLLTDFGAGEPYAGVMKGVILGRAPQARLVDLTHEVAPQDVAEGAFLLWSAFRYFPDGTIHLAVVDPGVGAGRPAVAIEAGGHRFVGPDNGLFSLALSELGDAVAVRLESARHRLPALSATFHGRDLFAPAAAALANGVPLADLGPDAGSLAPLPDALHVKGIEHGWSGHVIRVDRFGSLVTAVRPTVGHGHPGVVAIDDESLQLAAHSSPPWNLGPLTSGSSPTVQAGRPGDRGSETGGASVKRPGSQSGSGEPRSPSSPASHWRVRVEGRDVGALRRTYAEAPPGALIALVGGAGTVEVSVNQGSAAQVLGVGKGARVEVVLVACRPDSTASQSAHPVIG